MCDRPVWRESLSSQRSWTYSGHGAGPEYTALTLDTPTQYHTCDFEQYAKQSSKELKNDRMKEKSSLRASEGLNKRAKHKNT